MKRLPAVRAATHETVAAVEIVAGHGVAGSGGSDLVEASAAVRVSTGTDHGVFAAIAAEIAGDLFLDLGNPVHKRRIVTRSDTGYTNKVHKNNTPTSFARPEAHVARTPAPLPRPAARYSEFYDLLGPPLPSCKMPLARP